MARILFKAMIGAVLMAAVIAERFSTITGGSFLLCGVPMFALFLLGDLWLVWKRCYRPGENHVGIIYRFDRFHRFTGPNQWVFLWPFFESVHHQVSLYIRTAELVLRKVELRDGLIVDAKFKIFFVTDPRLANSTNLLQILRFQGEEWTEIVKTNTEDVVRNQVFLNLTYPQMIDLRKNREIKRLISREVASRLRGFGIVLNADYGVMPLVVQPNSVYQDAMQTSRAAAPIGEAAYIRLRPVLEALRQLRAEDANAALLLEIASKIVEKGELPEIVLSPSSELPMPPILGIGHSPGGSGGGHRPKLQPPPSRDTPLAN